MTDKAKVSVTGAGVLSVKSKDILTSKRGKEQLEKAKNITNEPDYAALVETTNKFLQTIAPHVAKRAMATRMLELTNAITTLLSDKAKLEKQLSSKKSGVIGVRYSK